MSRRVDQGGAGRDAHAQVAALRARLIAWDVLGVYQDDAGPGDDNEYDDLIAPVLRWLSEGVDATELSIRIVRFLRQDYGLDYRDDLAERPFAQSLVEWWRSVTVDS